MQPETSPINGEAPILLESGNNKNAITTIFGNRVNAGVSIVGFGAEQVILVRDDCVRKEVKKVVGKQALVLTIVECKGLEFQVVIMHIYSFNLIFHNLFICLKIIVSFVQNVVL